MVKMIQIRKKKGMTQGELAEACGTTQQQIAKIEKGLVDPKLSTLRRISDALKCEVRDLFWTRQEFLRELKDVMKEHKITMKNLEFVVLNNLCVRERKILPFHPYWEQLEIKNNTLKFKEM